MIHPVRTQVLSKIHGQQIESSMDQSLDIYVNLYISTAVKGNWFPEFRQLDF